MRVLQKYQKTYKYAAECHCERKATKQSHASWLKSLARLLRFARNDTLRHIYTFFGTFAELSLCTVCFYPTILNNLFGNHLHCQDDKDSYNNDVVELTKYRYKIRNDVERHKYVTHCKPEEIPCQLRGPVVF